MSFKTYNLLLDVAAVNREIPRAGHAFLVRRASSADAALTVRFIGGAADGEVLTCRIGDGWRFVAYDKLQLSWASQPGQWLQLIAWGDLQQVQGNEPEVYISPTPTPAAAAPEPDF